MASIENTVAKVRNYNVQQKVVRNLQGITGNLFLQQLSL